MKKLIILFIMLCNTSIYSSPRNFMTVLGVNGDNNGTTINILQGFNNVILGYNGSSYNLFSKASNVIPNDISNIKETTIMSKHGISLGGYYVFNERTESRSGFYLTITFHNIKDTPVYTFRSNNTNYYSVLKGDIYDEYVKENGIPKDFWLKTIDLGLIVSRSKHIMLIANNSIGYDKRLENNLYLSFGVSISVFFSKHDINNKSIDTEYEYNNKYKNENEYEYNYKFKEK